MNGSLLGELPENSAALENSACESTTVVGLVRMQAKRLGHRCAYTFLVDGEREEVHLSYAALDLRAQTLAVLLREQGVMPGDRVVLVYPPGLEYVAAFLGCLYAGAVAVPTYPPRRNSSLKRIQGIVEDAGATAALTTAKVQLMVATLADSEPWLKPLRWIASDDVATRTASGWVAPDIDGETLALLQYTSGSTATPKGVMVTHRNLLLTLDDLDRGWKHTAESVLVSWLPMFHDMGLIYGILQPLAKGIPCVFMPSAAFLQRPMRWLEAISRFRGTHSGGPNFAYELCLRRTTAEQRAGLDLSCWRMALNAAEPVRADTLRRFAEGFAESGFRAAAFSPGYGLAESTLKATAVRTEEEPTLLAVSGDSLEVGRVTPTGEGDVDARVLVGCGRSEIGTRIVIADPETSLACEAGEVGEIWLSGPVVAKGYWNRPEQSAESFAARLADADELSKEVFLRTGDTGFLHEDELFVTGRLKDLIIVRGVNHYPQDIELTVQRSHPALTFDSGAAFSLEVDGDERLVVVQEVERTARHGLDVNAVTEAIRLAVTKEHDLQAHEIVLLQPASLPKTSSGKIQRQKCKAQYLAGELSLIGGWAGGSANVAARDFPKMSSPVTAASPRLAVKAIQEWLVQELSKRLGVPASEISIHEPFASYGLDSLGAIGLTGELETWMERRLDPTLAYDYPSVAALAGYLAGINDAQKDVSEPRVQDNAIAIVGMGCRLPGAANPAAFWTLLEGGVDAISQRRRPDGAMRWGGFLEETDRFDAGFFGMSAREAEQVDPQQRLLLEVTWEALENAGLTAAAIKGTRTGVFVGISSNEYSRIAHDVGIDAYSSTGNAASIAANRLSYHFDLRGPSLAVDTACSSSLVAVHQAVQSLRNGESDLALAGGVSLMLSDCWTVAFEKAGMLAPGGRCKTFDAKADGYVRGEGCGVVVLKRLSDAVAAGDDVVAVIGGSCVNQDGRSNGLTAPSGPSQQAVVRGALKDAGVSASAVGYVEAHGTGTSLGDPIELNSLKEVLGAGRTATCWVGSVKTNVGHLEAAAGICGLIKVALALRHEVIPAHLHLQELNPLISLDGSMMAIASERQSWTRGSQQRVAGLSSFGFGGTNAHVVLTEAPARDETRQEALLQRPAHVLAISAKSAEALNDLAREYVRQVEGPLNGAKAADIAFSANTGRTHFRHRLAVVGNSVEEFGRELGKKLSGATTQELQTGKQRNIAFLFTGQGSHYAGMGRQLYETQPVFRATLERCDELLRPVLKTPLLQALYGDSEAIFSDAAVTQVGIFAVEYALAEMWRSWGVEPAFVMGHSLGEFAAACVAGCFSLEEGLELVAERGRLMQGLLEDERYEPAKPGQMAAVFAGVERVEAAVRPYAEHVSIAALNGPEHVVISGSFDAMAKIIGALEAAGVLCERLPVAQAFHAPPIQPMLDAFEKRAGRVTFREPQISLVSNLTGRLLAPGETVDATYWRRHARDTVRFHEGIGTLLSAGVDTLIEIGPHPTLLALGKRCQGEHRAVWLPSLRRGKQDWDVVLGSVAAAYSAGVDVDWGGFDQGYSRERVAVPTYPFQRKRYWAGAEAGVAADAKAEVRATSVAMGRREALGDALLRLIAELLHVAPEEIEPQTAFLDMGADSIVLLDAVRRIEQMFGVKIPIRSFFEKLTNVALVADHLDVHAPAEWAKAKTVTAVLPAVEAVAAPVEMTSSRTVTEQIVLRQLELMAEQIKLLGGAAPVAETAVVRSTAALEKPTTGAAQAAPPAVVEKRVLRPSQQRYLEDFTARFTARTGTSKQRAQESRGVLADLRSVMALRPELKELCYPIVAKGSKGSRFWDVDGHEYVDLAMGFGVNLFGHRVGFVEEAIKAQLEVGIQVGPQSNLAAEAAGLISEFTGFPRVTFCNSGTEAVMTAVRLVRAASGRTKVVTFSGSYHGHYDGTLAVARRREGEWSSVVMAPGIPQTVADDVLVLPYGEMKSLETIAAHMGELAAVLVEPVQSRNPGLQPREFVARLREMTREAGVALIFDEVITGFRVHPGGAKEIYGVEPDLATYGKVLGGGMPIGVVAGGAKYLDRVDGGMWQYGDESQPEVPRTFVAGTFCKHPLAMASVLAVLKHLRDEGPGLQEQLNKRTAGLIAALNGVFESEGLPIKAQHFGSLWRLSPAGNTSYVYQPLEMDLLYAHMVEKGVYVWEGRTCFLSTAHSDLDLERIVEVVRESVREMREGGFWNDVLPPAPGKMRTEPLTKAQKQLWVLSKMGDAELLSYKVSAALELSGVLDVARLAGALRAVVARHDALRMRIERDGERQEILPEVWVDCPLLDLSALGTGECESRLAQWLEEESRLPFNLNEAPLCRAQIAKMEEQRHVLVVSAHHLIVDGWSMGVVLTDLARIYAGNAAGLDSPMQFGEYVEWQRKRLSDGSLRADEAYWLEKFAGPLQQLRPPADRPEPEVKTYGGHRQTLRLDAELTGALRRLSRERGCTLFMTLLSAYTLLLHGWSEQDELLVGVPVAGRGLEGSEQMVGYCAHLLPVRSCLKREVSYADYLGTLKAELLADYEHAEYPFAELVEVLRARTTGPLVTALFNLERPLSLSGMPGLEVRWVPHPISHLAVELNLNVTEMDGDLVVDLEGDSDRWEAASIARGLAQFETLLRKIVAGPEQAVVDLAIYAEREAAPVRATLSAASETERVGEVHHLPASETERKVLAIYRQVLGTEEVGVGDNFFAMGGHSLLAAKVRSRVREMFQVELPMRRLFDLPTISLLSAHLDGMRSGESATAIPALLALRQTGAQPLSFAQQRLWFLSQHDAIGAAFNMCGAVRLRGTLDVEALRVALREILKRQEVLRARFSLGVDGPVQTIADTYEPELRRVKLHPLSAEEQEEAWKSLAQNEALAPFDLERGPLLRLVLIELSGEHVLLLTVHHIVFDGWSIGVFFRELSKLYPAQTEGRSSSLAAPKIQYADFARWQRQWMVAGHPAFEALLGYWREQLAELPTLALPTDHARPALLSYRGAQHHVTLPGGLSNDVRWLAKRQGCTTFMTLLAGFEVLLAQWSGQEDLVVGADVANRNRRETEDLVGFFVNQLVLRTRVGGNPTFRELMALTRDVVLAAEEHQDLPFDKLVDALRPKRELNRSPLFQVKVVFSDAPAPALELPGMQMSLVEIETGTTQLDLILFLVDAPEGIRVTLEYSTDLFEASTVKRMADEYESLLQQAIAAPDAALSTLRRTHLMQVMPQLPTPARRQRTSLDVSKLKSVRPATTHPADDMFRTSTLSEGRMLPLVLQPPYEGADLTTLAIKHRVFLDKKLETHGALLFRGFDTGSVEAFDSFTNGICSNLYSENGEHETVAGNIATPVFFAPERKLLWHNENTFNHQWPQKIWFCCVKPAERGGETPLVDSRKVYARLAPEVRERFERLGIKYVRNYGQGAGRSWQEVFRTTDRAVVEAECRKNFIEFEWKDEDGLRTSSIRPAVVRHPATGEPAWINQAQHWHLACLDPTVRESLLSVFSEEDLPRNCFYGDGSVIADEDMRAVCALYDEFETDFPWQKGDVLMVDNILTAHARNPYAGERKLLVAMGELSSFAQVAG